MLMAKTILDNLLKKYSTRLHPAEQRILPEGFRGCFTFIADKCILCNLCVKKCPTKVIRIDSDVGLWEQEILGCIYCGVCEDVCPTRCIIMSNVYKSPITEQAFLRFNVKPKAKKGKDIAREGEAKAAVEETKAKDGDEAKVEAVGKVEIVEEAVKPASKTKAESTAAKKKTQTK